MSKIVILCSCAVKDASLQKLVEYYSKLNQSYLSFEIDFYGSVKTQGKDSALLACALEKEAALIDKKLKADDLVIVLSEHGKAVPTLTLLEDYELWLRATGRVVFVLGGAYGFLPAWLAGKKLLSLSPLTFAHELALVIWLEQLYRLNTLRSGKKYHY